MEESLVMSFYICICIRICILAPMKVFIIMRSGGSPPQYRTQYQFSPLLDGYAAPPGPAASSGLLLAANYAGLILLTCAKTPTTVLTPSLGCQVYTLSMRRP